MTQLPKANSVHHFILISARELRHVVILLEMKHLFIDVFHVWPLENGNIGLNGFWSSLVFTSVAITSPIVCLYGIFPWLLKSSVNASMLSKITCAYGASWIFMALVSIWGIARKIPAFRDVHRVDQINLTSFPSCVRNYMAIGSIIWEGFQLNTTSFSVWKMSHKPKQLAALTIIDLQDLGLGFVQVDLFRTKQALSLICLVLWCFCLKASNKFKSTQWLNYAFTFLLPNLLGSMLFMFLSKQFYLSTACFENEAGEIVLWSNSEMRCWTSERMT